MYTSGSTGKPKGVEIPHSSICHYISVASKLYEMNDKDRVQQGFTLGFDASLEERWMAFANGAALTADSIRRIRLIHTPFIQFQTKQVRKNKTNMIV
ncbi:AMP-binding protein [Legionella moravica]|uniref:AMP-binding protein n=1 Tax=Legionella moravica TaxID=39962 RepID=UPI002379583B|nr:AMP-binding protein [Legionella moravica]